ncbi:MAG: chromosomal replication initiator protein DnaA [Campylobacterales bacterium]
MLGQFTLKQLKDEISENEYERYIKKLKYDEKASRSDMCVYQAPNMFVANWVKTKYSNRIAHLFELQTGQRPKVKITVQSGKNETPEPRTSEKSKKVQKTVILNPSFTFDSFVIGGSNQFAFTVSKNVSHKPGVLYNPLLIYGGTGLGKTHLLNAVGNENIKKSKSIIYVTSEQFLNDFMLHVNNQTMDRFRDKYRECDFLLIDDVQFFSNKNAVQEEFFHTFNELHGKNKQIIMTSDKHPKQIVGLEERLKSRFEWGLVADIQPPELETKIAIIKKKCELDRVYLSNEIIDYIATNMDNNIREIEGVIIRLNAYSSLMNQEITLDFVKNVLKEQIKEKRENITLDLIIKVVSRELNIKPSEIKSKSRSANIANARRIVIYLARTLTPNSMPSLAKFFGMKDHSSVSKAMKKVQEITELDAEFKTLLDNLKNKITSSKVD